MSTVILDTITGKSTATTITIGSTPVVSASANSMTIRGEGTAQTSIQQGLAKMWVHFAGSGSQTVGDSFNHASITDDATGRYTVVYTNNMANDDYSGSYDATAVNNNSGEATYIQTYATSSISVKHYENGTNYDAGNNVVTVHGDLA